jgi:iron complex transport system substrate-binding protein
MRHVPYLIWAATLLCRCALAASVTATDDTGRQVVLAEPAARIISLSPHATELLFAAGAGAQVVGVASYSDYPPAAQGLPAVGSSGNLNLEAIIGLKPDLVVAWKSGNAATQVERLVNFGIPVFFSEPRRLEDIATNLQQLGALTGNSRVADEAARRFREGYREIGREYSGRTQVRTFYQIWHQLISQVITLCGGRNIFADLETLAPVVSLEAVVAADPQAIIASGETSKRPDWLESWQAWPQVSAVKHGQIYVIDPDLIQRQTPRILQGARTMCRQLEQARRAAAP